MFTPVIYPHTYRPSSKPTLQKNGKVQGGMSLSTGWNIQQTVTLQGPNIWGGGVLSGLMFFLSHFFWMQDFVKCLFIFFVFGLVFSSFLFLIMAQKVSIWFCFICHLAFFKTFTIF